LITIDRRELQEIVSHRDIPDIEELSSLIGVPLRVDTLDAGDFAFIDKNNEVVGIERSEIKNLMQKLRSGELEAQLARCDEHYNTVFLLIEGVYDHVSGFLALYKRNIDGRVYFRNRIEPNTRYAEAKALEIRLSELGIEVIGASNFDCSMRVISAIYHQRTKLEEEHTLFKKIRPIRIPVKLSANPAVPMLLALCPRLPEGVAIRLIYQYDSIWNILHADDKEILKIKGMGRGLLNKLKQGVGKE